MHCVLLTAAPGPSRVVGALGIFISCVRKLGSGSEATFRDPQNEGAEPPSRRAPIPSPTGSRGLKVQTCWTPPEDRATHMFYKHRRFLRWEPFPPVSFYSARTSIPALSGTRFASRLSAPSNSLIHSYTAAQEVAPCKCARSPASESRSGSSLSSEKAAGGR